MRIWLCALGVIGASVIAVLTGGRASGQNPLPPLKIAGNMTTIELAPVLVAANGIYPGQISVQNGGIPDLVKGDVDAATNAETQALRQSVDDPGIRIIFTVSEGLYRVVAKRSAGIRTIADLRGKKITTSRNTSAHWYLVKSLGRANVAESEVTIVPVNPLSQMPGAIKNGQVDAVSIWEPEAENSVAILGGDAIVLQEPNVYRELFNLQTSTKVLADPAKRRAIVEFLRSLIAASERVRSRPEEIRPLLSSKLGYTEAVIARSWVHHRYAGTLAPDLLDVMEEEEKWVAKERNRTPRNRAQLATLIDGSLLAEALKR